MYILRLFQTDLSIQPVDARLLRLGKLSIGRDPSADWVIHDPDCRISRWHLELLVKGGSMHILCTGANGVFDDVSGHRFPDQEEIALVVPTTLRFGDYRLVIDTAVQTDSDNGREGQTFIMSPPLGTSAKIPTEYADEIAPVTRQRDGSLFDIFCEGAGLEPSVFSLEDPEDIMRRAGAVYRQMVLGIGDLMAERESMRRRYDIARTTINGANNNPFKWGPTQRLARDLLMAENHGFITGPTALKESFKDIKKHLIATFVGLHASLRTMVDAFEPAAIDSNTSLRQSLLQSRAARICAEVEKRHSEFVKQIEHGEDGSLNQSFVKAYDAASIELDGETS